MIAVFGQGIAAFNNILILIQYQSLNGRTGSKRQSTWKKVNITLSNKA